MMALTSLRRGALLTLALAGGLALTAPAPVAAQQMGEVITDPAKIPGGTWQLDPSHTNVVWYVRHLGMSNYAGRFNTARGELKYNPEAPDQSTVVVQLDPASVDVTSEELERELKVDPKFLNVGRFPFITFTSTKLERGSGNKGKLTGELDFLGVKKPVTFDVTFNGARQHPFRQGTMIMGFSASATIKRSDWGFTHLLPAIGDEVEVVVEIEFNQGGAR